jgi:FemAB-related protein (PEP-CTERM system-associated)
LKSLLFGNFMVSLPYFNYGGICTIGEENRYLLFRKAVELCRESSAAHLELRQNEPIAGLPAKTAKVSMRLELPDTPAALWDSFPAKLRSQVRRPAKEGMYATVGRAEELEGFYAVFADTMRNLGTPVYSQRFFENILRDYPASWICMIKTAGHEPVAGGFLIGFKDVLEIPWASSLRRFNRASPNMLLYSTALSFACEEGYRRFDFGRSSIGGSTYRFKEQWGAKPVQLFWHYWMRSGKGMPELNPHNPKYRAAIALWKRLPVTVTKLIGPSIVKNLP